MSLLKKLSWSLIGQLSSILIQFVGIIVLTKLINPAEFGIIGIIAFFTNIADMLIDSGMGGALIYKKDPVPEDFSTLFFYNLGVSLVLYFILFFCACPIALFYGVPSLVAYIRVYGISIIIIAFSITQDCKLKRKMDFKAISIISIVSNAVALCVAILAAANGLGVWALVLQTLLSLFIRSVLLYVVAGLNERYVFSFRSFKEQFSFGGWLFLANIINSVSDNIYSNVIPKIGTLTQNGYYTQSAKISNVPSNTISLTVNNVCFPYFAKFEDEKELVSSARALYRKIFHVSFPLFCFMALCSYEIVDIILGKQWLDAAEYLRILFYSGPFILIMQMLRNLLKSEGHTKEISALELIKSGIRLLCIFTSLFFGIKVLIYSILFSSVINSIIAMIFVSSKTSYTFRNQFVDMLIPLGYSLLVYFLLFLVYHHIGIHVFWNLAYILMGYAMYFLIAYLTKDKDILSMKDLFKSKINNRLSAIK